MRHATLFTSEKDFPLLMEIAKSLKIIKKIEMDEEEEAPTKAQILSDLKESIEEMKLMRAGKLKKISAREIFDEL